MGLMGDRRAFLSRSGKGSQWKSSFQSNTPRCRALEGWYWNVFQSITSMTGDTTRLLEGIVESHKVETIHLLGDGNGIYTHTA